MIPNILKLYIDAEKWELIVQDIRNYFEEDLYFDKIDDRAYLHLKENALYENTPYDLEALVQKIQNVSVDNLTNAVYEYFDQFYIGSHPEKLNAFITDFEQVKTRLYPRVYSKRDMTEEEINQQGYIYKIDYEDTFTLILFSLPHDGWLLNQDKAKRYNKSIDEIWQATEENAASLYRKPFSSNLDNINFHFIGHKHTSAGYIPQYLAKNHPETIGTFGTILSIPRNGTVILHPVTQKSILKEAIDMLLSGTIAAYQQGKEAMGIAHDAINCELYWYYEGTIQKLIRHDPKNPVVIDAVTSGNNYQQLIQEHINKRCIILNPEKLFYTMPEKMAELLEDN